MIVISSRAFLSDFEWRGQFLTLTYRTSDICKPAVECHLYHFFKVRLTGVEGMALAGDGEKDAGTGGQLPCK